MALQTDGTVIAWGNPSLTNVNLADIVAIAAGLTFGVALMQDGTVICWGTGAFAPTNVPATATNLARIFAGPLCVFGVRRDGIVIGWGYHFRGGFGLPPELVNPIKIVCNHDQATALREDGRVITWGYVLPDAITSLFVSVPECGVTDIALCGPTNLMVGRDGRLYTWSSLDTNAQSKPQPLDSCLSNVTAVAASDHVLAVVSWGPPLIESVPEAVFVEPWAEAQIIAAVTGCNLLEFQWFKDGIKLTNTACIAGATTSTLTINAVGPVDVA